jgi:hypothetical protein
VWELRYVESFDPPANIIRETIALTIIETVAVTVDFHETITHAHRETDLAPNSQGCSRHY